VWWPFPTMWAARSTRSSVIGGDPLSQTTGFMWTASNGIPSRSPSDQATRVSKDPIAFLAVRGEFAGAPRVTAVDSAGLR
jgi:hypothetical protein